MTAPRVGVGIVVRRGELLLLMRRAGAHGEGTWSTPGGNLDFGEEPAGCAVREAEEETALRIGAPRFVGATNDVFAEEGRHYVTLWFEAEAREGDPRLSGEATELGWFHDDELPEPLFLALRHLLDGEVVR